MRVAYDGANYAGWQWQKNDISVQQKIEEAIKRLNGNFVRLHGCSRTDSGVHAVDMVAHADFENLKIPPRQFPLAVNSVLPEDIRIQSAEWAHPGFHARFSATGKEYRYFIWNAPAANPLLRTRAWHIPRALDILKMREAAKSLIGKHDFRSFANMHNYEIADTVRTVQAIQIRRAGPSLVIQIRGDGFLYKMCRTIVGTLVDIGVSKYPVTFTRDALQLENREEAGQCAPAHGLVLWKVFYD